MIAILGGSGDFGQGLAERLRRIGEEVLVGSRTPRDGMVANAEAAARAEIVFLSVPPGAVEATAQELAGELTGRIVVSVASPVVFREGRPGAEPGELSLAEQAARAAPDARVVAGWHTVSARALADLEHPLDEDVILCGDDREAKEAVAALSERLVEGRAVDAGRLEVARWLEPVTAVIININRRYRTNAGIRVTGID